MSLYHLHFSHHCWGKKRNPRRLTALDTKVHGLLSVKDTERLLLQRSLPNVLKAREYGLAWPVAKVSRCPWLIRMAEEGPKFPSTTDIDTKLRMLRAPTVGSGSLQLSVHTPDHSSKPGLSVVLGLSRKPSRSRCHPAGLICAALPGEHWRWSRAGTM